MIFQWILFFLNIIALPGLVASYKYNLSICMIFKDEAPYLKEWIEFHRLLGVQHFYLYNNLSQDHYQEVLEPYIKRGIVDLIEWNLESHHEADWNVIQIGAYNDGFNRAKETSKWLAILDSDEFLFPTVENNLFRFLERYENLEGFGGLLVNWVCFGTSWIPKIPEDKLLIETLTLCAPEGSDHFKSVFLTDRVAYVCSAHYVVYKEGYVNFTSSGFLYPPFVVIDQIRINHYWSRDEWYLNNFKIPRRLIWGTDALSCKHWAETSNKVSGTEILRFVKPLRRRVYKKY